MNVAIIPDLHLRDHVSSRVDNYGEVLLDKLRFIKDRAIVGDDDLLVLLGDIYDSVEYTSKDGKVNKRPVSLSLESSFRSILYECSTSPISLKGNHDLVGDSLDSFERTGLGLNPCIDTDMPHYLLATVGMHGIHAYQDYTESYGDVRILLLHGFISENEHNPKELMYSVAEAKRVYPTLKYIFAGHDHTVRPPVEILGVTVYRPGSLGRVSASVDAKANRCFYLIENAGESSEVVKRIEVPTKPYESTFLSRSVSESVNKANAGFIARVVEEDNSFDMLTSALNSIDDIPVRNRIVSLLKEKGLDLR